MAGTYPISTTVLVRGRFYDEAAQPTDPAGVMLKVRKPNGVTATLQFTDPGTTINRVSQGHYTTVVRATMPGRWGYQWSSTAPSGTGSQPAEEGYFDVRPSVV